jgi:hypothetical protein
MNNWTVIKMPSWLPVSRFKRYAREWYPLVISALKTPFDKVKKELVSVIGTMWFTVSKSLILYLIRLFRRPERQLTVLPQTPYPNSTKIQRRKTFGLPSLFQGQCIRLVLTAWVLFDLSIGSAFQLNIPQTVSAVRTFILAMTLYPEVQRKAQAELDQIVGNSRLPDFSDEATLPYVQAVLKEVLRWHPVAPLGRFSCVAGIVSLW